MPKTVTLKTLRFFSALFGLAIVVPGCVPRYGPNEVVKDTSYFAAPYTITEEVQHDYSSLGDDYFRRVYVVQTDGQEVVSFEGDTTMWNLNADLSMGNPKVVDGWLSVFSLERVWIWQPGQPVRTFDPLDPSESPVDDVWTENQLTRPDSWGHRATDFQISGDQWFLEYTDFYGYEFAPEHFYFISEDQGETFVPVVDLANVPSGLFESDHRDS